MRKILSVLLVLSLMLSLLAGCGLTKEPEYSSNNNSSNQNNTVSGDDDTTADPVDVDFSQTDADMFTARDLKIDYDASEVVTIQLNGTSANASSTSVKISGSTVTITEEATYLISGELTDGMIVVNAADTAKLQLIFNGVNVTSKTSAALYILEADKVFVTLAAGSDNSLENGGSFEAIDDNNIDAAVFSKQDLTLNGTGSLTVTSPAGHGIVCKDDLVITGGTYVVNSASHGLDANDSVRLSNAILTIDAGKDAIHSENSDDASLGFVYISSGTVKGEAEGDGIAAGAYIQMEGGNIDLLVGGGSENGTKASSGNYGGFMGGGMRPGGSTSSTTEDTVSMKGLKAANSILINAGTIKIDSADDAIHSDVSITINGGTFDMKSGDDGVHAEEELTITNCDLTVGESYEGLEAHKIYVKGGTILLHSSDDGINAAGGADSSGTTGGRDGMFGGPMGGRHGFGGSSDGVIDISGGKLTIYSSGDGMDANGQLTISDGYIYVANPTAGDTSVIDSDQDPVISGGTFISTGSTTMMAQSFGSSSTQGVIARMVGNQKAGGKVTVTNSDGEVVISYDVEYSTVLVIISSPDIVKGKSYTLTVGSSSGTVEAD